MKKISQIEDSFQISGRGCVIVIPKSALQSNHQIKIGDLIQLRNAAVRVFDTQINGVEISCGLNARGDVTAFLISGDIQSNEIPPGTELWLVND